MDSSEALGPSVLGSAVRLLVLVAQFQIQVPILSIPSMWAPTMGLLKLVTHGNNTSCCSKDQPASLPKENGKTSELTVSPKWLCPVSTVSGVTNPGMRKQIADPGTSLGKRGSQSSWEFQLVPGSYT